MPRRTKGPDSLAETSGSVADELVQGGVMEADTPQRAAHRHLADPELSIDTPFRPVRTFAPCDRKPISAKRCLPAS